MLVQYITNMVKYTDLQISLVIDLNYKELEVFLPQIPQSVKIVHIINTPVLLAYRKSKIVRKQKNRLLGFIDELLFNPIRRIVTGRKISDIAKENDVLIDFDCHFGKFIKSKWRVKKITFFHFSLSRYKDNPKELKRIFTRMQSFNHIVMLCQGMLDEALELCPTLANKYVVINNFVNPEKISQQAETALDSPFVDRPYIIAVERLDESSKDLTTLIKAYAILKESTVNAPAMIIVGEGESRQQLEQLVCQLNLTESVYMPGFMSNPYPWIKGSEIMVHSSKSEGFGLSLVEGLMLNKLIVSTNCRVGPDEILDNGKAGLLVTVGDAQELANAMNQLLTDNNLRTYLLKNINK